MKHLYKPTQKHAASHLLLLLPFPLPKPLLPFKRGTFFFCFCSWKELFEASYWNLFSTTLWYLSCAPGRARSANSSNVSVRPTSWRGLAYPANQSTSSSSGAGHWYQLAVEHGSNQRVTTQSVKTETATIMGEPRKGGKASAFNRKPLDRRLVREVLKPCLTNNFSIWPISATHL